MDRGDIVLQRKISIAPNETFDTLLAKNYLEGALLLEQLLANFKNLYSSGERQHAGAVG